MYTVGCWQEQLTSNEDILVARFTADGVLDPDFGTDGQIELDITSPYYIIPHDALLDPQGRILIVARDLTGLLGYRMAVIRLLPDGSLDATFGDGGVARFTAMPNGPTIYDSPVHVAVDAAGRILLAASARNGVLAPDVFFAARLTPTGDLDPTFSGDGRVSVFTGYSFPVAAVDAAGRVVGAVGNNVEWTADGTQLFRLLPDGEGFDPTFGEDGVVMLDLNPTPAISGKAEAIEIDSAGRIIVTGMGDLDDDPGMFVARFLPDGTLDASFGDGGIFTHKRLISGIGDTLYPRDIATDPDGRVVVAGDVARVFAGWDQFVIRLTSSGTLDSTFSGDGVAITDTYPGATDGLDSGARVTIDGQGRILTSSGTGIDGSGWVEYITVTRYLAESDGPVGHTPGDPWFVDTWDSIFEADIDWLADEAITTGCNPPANDRFCPNNFVTRGQMAAFLVRAMGYTDNGGGDLFIDDDASIFEGDIDRLGTAGVTTGCNPPANDRFCPNDFVTRGQMAAFLHRALAP